MHPVTFIFGAVSLLIIALAYCADERDRADAMTLAVVLFGVWVAGVAEYRGGSLANMSYVDLTVAGLAGVMSIGRSDWRRTFFGLCAIQIGVNLGYGIWGNAVYDAYFWLINGSGALQLAVIGERGVRNAGRNMRDCLRPFLRLRRT